MAKYNVYGKVTGLKFLGEVEANSEDEAIEKVVDEAYVNLCHQCDKEVDGAEVNEITAEKISD